MNFADFANGENKFVCPSDRHLALRAKLQTGWSSVKTGQLRPEEQAAIISVIQRNEEVENAERQRVGRLVDRVEKIRLHTIDAGPNTCHLCGDTFRLLTRKIICEDCKRITCTKCSLDISVRYHTMEKSRIMWLCRMCSETREMWKKTGAWFFKGLPKYDIHAAANNANNDSKIKKKLAIAQKNNELVREKRVKKLTIHVKDSSSSSSENEGTEGSAHKSKESRSSIGEVSMQRGDSLRLRTLDKLRGFINSRERKLSNAFSLGRQSSRVDNADADGVSLQSRAENGISRCGSVSSFWSNSDSSVTNSSGTAGKANNATLTAAKAETALPRDPLLGWLELSIVYRKALSVLEVTVIRAFDLTPMDADGLADAFCQVNILHVNENSGAKYTRWQRTKTVHKTRNPAFNETLQLTQVQATELAQLLLYICLYDNDKYGYDFLGAAKISLETLQGMPQRFSVPLGLEDYYSKQAWTAHEWPRAELHIALCYNTKRRALLVHINQCVNLIPMDNNGSSDPFIKLQYKHKKYKTGVKWRTLNPVFNEEFCFETSPHDLDKEVLTITVWDMDLAKSNDFLGSLVLGHCSKGARLQQWLSCIRRPDHFHDRWHCLSYEMPSAAERAKRYTSNHKLK